jgi:hypothetical protein
MQTDGSTEEFETVVCWFCDRMVEVRLLLANAADRHGSGVNASATKRPTIGDQAPGPLKPAVRPPPN